MIVFVPIFPSGTIKTADEIIVFIRGAWKMDMLFYSGGKNPTYKCFILYWDRRPNIK